MSTEYSYYPLTGSLDTASPALTMRAGSAIECVNFEPGISGGFRRIKGYERFDGRAKPSDATFYRMEVADNTAFVVDTLITGGTSAATAQIIAVDPDGVSLYVTAIVGTFVEAEVAGDSTITQLPVERDTTTALAEQTYLNLAADYYRTRIFAVLGSGPIRGIWVHRDKVYTFRDSVDGLRCVPHQATATGWETIPLYSYIMFDTGTNEPAADDELTGLVSGATGVVKRAMVRSGAWSSNNAEGYFIVDVTSGTFADTEELQVTGVTQATATSDSTQIAFSPGGRFEMISENFLSTEEGYSVFGVNGLDPAFEINIDGILTPLFSKATQDTPKYIQAYKQRLFVGFTNGSVQFSVVGTPHSYEALLGAGEIGLGSDLTGMVDQPGGLVLATNRQTFILEGSSVADFVLTVASDSTGAKPYTMQSLSRIYAMDDRGIIQLDRTNAFGNFESASVSRSIQSLVDRRQNIVTCSTVVRATNQYRLFFSDNTAFATYPVEAGDSSMFNATLLNYGRPVLVICNNEDLSGEERIMFGSDDGFIYEDQRGTSFDGEPIEAWVRLAFNNMQSPRTRKRWRKAVFELDGDGYVQMSVTPDLSYSSTDAAVSSTQETTIFGGGGYWDTDNWDSFVWDAQTVSAAETKLFGTGTNVGLLIHTISDLYNPFTLQGIILHFDKRRLQR